MRVIPRRRSAHADLAQPTERAALDGLTVVLLLEPFLQFLTREVKSSGNANRTRLRASASAKLRASASVPQPGVRSQPATTGFSSVITRSRSATSLRSATGGTNP